MLGVGVLAALAFTSVAMVESPSPVRADPSQCNEFPEGQGSETVEGYYQPAEIERVVQKLEHTGQGVTTDVIGTSNQGRPIYSVRVGSGAKVVFLQAGIHANEPTGTIALVNVLNSLSDSSRRSQQIREAVTIVAVPQLNPDGAIPYQRENHQTWDDTVSMFPQLAGAPSAFYHSLPGPRFWSDPRVPGFDLNRDFNPDFDYAPQAGHLPGSGSVRGMYLTPEARASRDLYTALEQEFGLVDVFVDLHNQAPCNTFDDGDAHTPDLHTPMSISAQFLRDPGSHGAGTMYPNFGWDASRRANVAAWEGVQRGGSTFSGVTRYPQNLNLAGSANATYQLRGSASVLMEAGRQRHANPQWRHGFIAKVHELAMMGIIDSLVDNTFEDIDPNRYEEIPVRNG
ncbi:M14 family zinc carboxypeptidase [Micromonospora costi]|nr:M14 family zinc carboxypeptidase [Micromonospora costi]